MLEILTLALFNVSLLNLQLNPPPPVDQQLIALEQCESGGKDITILDTNNRYSHGWFQFQTATFNKYGELYNLPHDNIHSRVEQYEIAKAIIFDGGWRNWYNCGKTIFSQDST